MINPLESTFFSHSYNISHRNFDNSELLLSILFSKGNYLLNYLLLKKRNKDEYLICGFDFVKETVIPVEIKNVNDVIGVLEDFLSSEYNTMNLVIEEMNEALEYFRNKKMKNGIENYKTFSILTSTQRNIISGSSEVFSNGKQINPYNSIVIHNKSGFIFGEFKFKNNSVVSQELKKIHLSEDWVIRYQIDNYLIVTAGTVYELKKVKGGSNIILSSFIHELANKEVDLLSFQGSDPKAPFQAILRTSGISKEQINIEGYTDGFAPYLVLIPIENLSLKSLMSLGLGDVTFLTKDEAVKKYNGFKEKSNSEIFDSYVTFAQTIVESDNGYDAYLLGKQKIQDTIDIMMLMSKNERIYNLYNLGNELNEWNRLKLHQNPNCSTIYYVENILNLDRLLGDSKNTLLNNSLDIDYYFESLFREQDWLEEKLYQKQKKVHTALDKQLFNALKWLNRSWKAKDKEDKVIYTNIAMEFLVDKIETDPYLPNDVIIEFKAILKKILKERNDIFNEEYSNKIKEKSFGKLTDPPLKIKVQALISQLSIPVEVEDFNKLWKVRGYRNDLVHGKDELQIDANNILIANILIGEFIIYRLSN